MKKKYAAPMINVRQMDSDELMNGIKSVPSDDSGLKTHDNEKGGPVFAKPSLWDGNKGEGSGLGSKSWGE